MTPRNYPPRRPKVRENVNEAIRVREVRAVFPDGTVEIMPTLAAVRKAGVDLLYSPHALDPEVRNRDGLLGLYPVAHLEGDGQLKEEYCQLLSRRR